MLFTAQLLFLVAIIRPVLAIQLTDWQCGHTFELRNLTFTTTVHECPLEAVHWNHCCVKHDECYARQLGQWHCDTEFDVCINGINTRLNASISCRFYSATASFMIKAVGEPSYRESVNYTEPLELVRHLPSDVSIPYRSVYEDCPLANATLSSCALKFNVCAGPATSTDGCRADLCECMRDAYKMDNVMTCNERVEFVCQLPVQAEERSPWWCPEFQLSVWLLYVMAILVLVVSCRYGCLWWKGRREGSYTLTV